MVVPVVVQVLVLAFFVAGCGIAGQFMRDVMEFMCDMLVFALMGKGLDRAGQC